MHSGEEHSREGAQHFDVLNRRLMAHTMQLLDEAEQLDRRPAWHEAAVGVGLVLMGVLLAVGWRLLSRL